MSVVPEGYREVSPEDREKAKAFFERGRTLASTGNYDYAIEMYMQGFAKDPDAVDAHQELRDISLKRKVSGGKNMGFMDARKLKGKAADDRASMLNMEKLLAFEPGNTDYMLSLMQLAHRAGYFDTLLWIGPILQKANIDDKKPDFNKFIALRDIYKTLKQWRLATEACSLALKLRPNDMGLSTEMKNLAAMDTMDSAGYAKGGSFRDQIKDSAKQQRLMAGDRDMQDADAMQMLIADAEASANADPNEPGKWMKLVDMLEKSETPENESRAVKILETWFEKTGQFRFRQRVGVIHMRQMARIEKSKRAAAQADPENMELRKEYAMFRREQIDLEMKEFQLASDAYPTDQKLRYEIGQRMFLLQKFTDAIPVFQQVRADPKLKNDATTLLARSFLEAGYIDEADETLATQIREYAIAGDARSKEMYYWRGRALELKKMNAEAISHYSKITQWDFGYRDVQARIKKLRAS